LIENYLNFNNIFELRVILVLFCLNGIDYRFNNALFSRIQYNNNSSLSLDNECDKRIAIETNIQEVYNINQ